MLCSQVEFFLYLLYMCRIHVTQTKKKTTLSVHFYEKVPSFEKSERMK